MALVRINEKTIVQKVKTFILGHEKPNWMTRISVLIGFFIWLYFIVWHAFIVTSILFVNRFQNPQLIEETFARIGGQYNFNLTYAAWNWVAIDVIFYHALGTMVLLLIPVTGLIIIYRRKKLGYITYLVGNALVALFAVSFLGLKYFSEQISMIDKVIFLAITLYFFVGMFLLKRTKAKEKTSPQLQS